ncbi:MAG TPA: SRPBCC domain-containing protein [Streptosporangiaceae bacterium]
MIPETDVVEVDVHIEAPAHTVFSYFTDPARYVQWMGREATIEPRPGGRYHVIVRPGVDAVGEFLEVDPPRRLVFTWGSAAHQIPDHGTTVEVTFSEENGGTRVVLRHYGIDDAEQRARNTGGWGTYLRRLAVLVSGGDPGPDPFGRPAVASTDAAPSHQ